MIRDYLDYQPKRLDEYHKLVMQNRIFKARTIGVGAYSLEEALDWGVTGPGLRACGLAWDYRKQRPYSGYDQLDFDIPPHAAMATATIAWSSISRRCGKASASSANASTICRPVSTDRSTG